MDEARGSEAPPVSRITMPRTILTNCLIFDGVNDTLVADKSVLIQDGKIIGMLDSSKDEPADNVLCLNGRTLTPGFIDAHFHAYASSLNFEELERLPKIYIANYGAKTLAAALRRGFTTVHDVGGADYCLWCTLEDYVISGPRLFWRGKALSQTGGHGDSRSPHIESCGCNAAMLEKLDGVANQGLDTIELCQSNSVALGLGADLLSEFQNQQLEKFALRAEVQPPADILGSATSGNAMPLGAYGAIGEIKAGAYADILVMNGNPLEAVSITKKCAQDGGLKVMKGGIWVH